MYRITLIPGDGIGPEVSWAARKVIAAAGVDITWEIVNAGEAVWKATGSLVPNEVYRSLEENRVALKGPITTPVGKGFRSINVMLRNKYDLFTNLRPVMSIPGVKTPFDGVDLVIFRENTEDLYCGAESTKEPGKAEAVKIITEYASKRIAKSAFEYAVRNGRKKVTVVHKANILKLTDGLFLETARQVSEAYPMIEFQERIIDNMCMQLVKKPEDYDVILTMNLYGDILSDLCAGLVGGLGVVPGANIGSSMAIFEAVHGSAPDIAGRNIANPTALILSGAMLLEHIGEKRAAKKVRAAVSKTMESRSMLTADMGGTASTEEFTDEIINNMLRIPDWEV
ncbi:MAG TPA: isocitrate/isopropylmalate dehydrogenase family protein [Clostridia bacterium]|nr:isocitrate/isopropylmalate dehydrogenase family protein [Clostridia bacterium]